MTTWKDIEDHWADFKPKFKTKWTKLTASDMERVKGRREEMVKLVVDRYAVTQPEATRQIDDFLKTLKPFATK